MDSTHSESPSSLSTPFAMDANLPEDVSDSPSSPSDSDLSQFEAEIEKNLSSASPPVNGTKDDSEDPMDVDSEDEKPIKTKRRTSTKEYFDPELYGLRRSVYRASE